jgi:hypothetical protein
MDPKIAWSRHMIGSLLSGDRLSQAKQTSVSRENSKETLGLAISQFGQLH